MSYLFKGNLCGRLCDDCDENLSNVQVKLYRIREDQPATVLAAANPKNTFSLLSEKEVKAKEKSLLSTTETDEKGNYRFELGKDQDYDGEAFEIDVYVERAPGQEEPPENAGPIQFTITSLQPRWRRSEDGFVSVWEYCIPSRFWCRIRELLDAWVICGQVLDCKDQQTPIPGVRVTAFDRDWIQDDPLGSALTDTTGHFKIYYSADDFKPGTFIDVELFGGPDLYFRVETTLGAPLLVEDPSRGRDADRENAGACFCVSLCLPEYVPPEPEEPLPFFSHVGNYEYEVEIDSGFPGSGFTLADSRAFFSALRLNGTLSKKLNGTAMEYRFEVREFDASGTVISGWNTVLASQIAKTKIGVLQKSNPDFPATSPNPIKNIDYVTGAAGPDEESVTIVNDGTYDWIQVPQESSSPLGSIGFFTPNHDLIRLDTRKLQPPFSDIDLTGLETGLSSTSTGNPLAENRHFAVRMMVREVGNIGPGTIAGICQHLAMNNTLYDNINSHPDWYSNLRSNQLAVAMVNIEQLDGAGSGCSGITNELDVLFTAVHPNLGAVNISMTGPGGPYSFTLPPISTPGDHFGTAAPDFSVSGLAPCAYIVHLSVQVLLTDGDHVPSNRHDQIAFCKA